MSDIGFPAGPYAGFRLAISAYAGDEKPDMRYGLLFLLCTLCGFTAAAGEKPPSRADANDGGKWQLTVDASSGAKSITATLPADAPIKSGFGEATPKLVLRYRLGRITAYVLFDTFLGSGDIDATVTFDPLPPEAQTWAISKDGRAAFVPGDPFRFLDQLKRADSLSVRVVPRNADAVTASFTTTGIQIVIKALISAGVKYGG
jgi:hypothetical protein